MFSQRAVQDDHRACHPLFEGRQEGPAVRWRDAPNLWDEMCVQVQGGPWFNWDSCLAKARGLIRDEVSKLNERGRQALEILVREWLLIRGDENIAPEGDAAVDYILNQHVLVEVARWKNRKIRAYFEARGDGAARAHSRKR